MYKLSVFSNAIREISKMLSTASQPRRLHTTCGVVDSTANETGNGAQSNCSETRHALEARPACATPVAYGMWTSPAATAAACVCAPASRRRDARRPRATPAPHPHPAGAAREADEVPTRDKPNTPIGTTTTDGGHLGRRVHPMYGGSLSLTLMRSLWIGSSTAKRAAARTMKSKSPSATQHVRVLQSPRAALPRGRA